MHQAERQATLAYEAACALGKPYPAKAAIISQTRSPISTGTPLLRFRLADELLLELLHLLAGVEVAHGPAQQVGLGQAEAGQVVGDAQHLLLVQDHPKGFLQQRRQGRMQVRTGFFRP